MQALKDAADAHPGQPVLVASDGGVVEPRHRYLRIGSWAAAVGRTDRRRSTFSDVRTTSQPLQGVDQTSYAAELAGALGVLRAANRASTAVNMLIDNRAVQRIVQARLRGAATQPRHGFKL